MTTVIKVENLSKQYRLGNVGTGSIAHDLNRTWHRVRGKEDPYLKIGEENDRSIKGNSDYIWALKDINFEVKKGEVLGIIGRNGAGKSTLLKILSRTTTPTTGQIKIKGRVASLLEVGTGFHPELSGRENIFLNGAILGMSKQEIKTKFDEIVDFAGVERYIDTPVKRYSSGMYVRLAFGVAAHLEPEILIVDEVLAVGDAEFQKKALGKMKDVSSKDGRTVLFVSHNMLAVRNLCRNAIILENGRFSFKGDVNKAISKHLDNSGELFENKNVIANEVNGLKIHAISLRDEKNDLLKYVTTDSNFFVVIDYSVLLDKTVAGFTIAFWNEYDEIVFISISNPTPNIENGLNKGRYKCTCEIKKGLLNNLNYNLSLNIFGINFENPFTIKEVLTIKVEDGNQIRKNYTGGYSGYVRPELKWENDKISNIDEVI